MKFACSINTAVRKEIGKSGKISKGGNFGVFNENWDHKKLEISDISTFVDEGAGLCSWHLLNNKRQKDGTGTIKAGLIIIDIDNQADGKDEHGNKIQQQELTAEEALELPICQKYLSLAYYSPSSTDEWPRFRLVFGLEKDIIDPAFFQWFTRNIASQIPGSDRRATQTVNLFYGCNVNHKERIIFESDNHIPSIKIDEAFAYYLQAPKEEAKDKDASSFLKSDSDEHGVNIEKVVCHRVKEIIQGYEVEDRSASMAMVFKELIGWNNFFKENNIKPTVSFEQVAELCFENIYQYAPDLDGKYARILCSILDAGSLRPSVQLSAENGDEAVWRKLRYASREIYAATAPTSIKKILDIKPKPRNSVMDWALTSTSPEHQMTAEKIPATPAELVAMQKEGAEEEGKQFGDAEIAETIVSNWGKKFLFDTTLDEFYFYVEEKGVWVIQHEMLIKKRIIKLMDTLAKGELIKSYTSSRVKSVCEILKGKLVRQLDYGRKSIWSQAKGQIAFTNGVLDSASQEFKPGNNPDHYLRTTLPYDYTEDNGCPEFLHWIQEAVGENKVILVQAFFRALLTNYTEGERFLHLVGPGGTGKSTLQQLLIALVGFDATHTTSLELLETSKFETFQLMGKKLVLLTDEANFNRRMDTIKKLTSASDTLRAERKYGKEVISFKPEALLCIASNEHISSSDTTSGLERRRFTIVMDNVVAPSKRRNLISVYPDRIEGVFVSELPAIINWALAMEHDQMRDVLANPVKYVPSMNQTNIEALILNNPIVAWLGERTLYHPEKFGVIGGGAAQPTTDERERGMYVRNPYSHVYASYVQYCKECGYKPYAKNRFIEMLKETANNVLKLHDVKVTLEAGQMAIKGIVLAPFDREHNTQCTGELRLPSPVEFAQDQSSERWIASFNEHS